MLKEFPELNLPLTFSRKQLLRANIFPNDVNIYTFVRNLFLANFDVTVCISHEHSLYVLSFLRLYF